MRGSYPEIAVPGNSFFVLGDHRTMSTTAATSVPSTNASSMQAVFGYGRWRSWALTVRCQVLGLRFRKPMSLGRVLSNS